MSKFDERVDEELLNPRIDTQLQPHQRRQILTGMNQDLEAEIQTRVTEMERIQTDFRSVVQKIDTGILIVDHQGRVCCSNLAAEKLLNKTNDELLGSHFGIPAIGKNAEMEVTRKGQDDGVVEVSATETEWGGRAAHLVMLNNITERKRVEGEVQRMAYYDALTGQPSRQLFGEHLDLALARARRAGSHLAVLFLDLDAFEGINEAFGRQIGDDLLKMVAERLGEQVRESDLVARKGSDEFTVMIEGLNSALDLLRPLESILTAFNEPFRLAKRDHRIGASIGIAVYPEHGKDGQTLLKNAEIAMRAAKRGEGAPYRHYTAEMSE